MVALRDLNDLRHLGIRHILRRPVAFRPGRGTDGTIAHRKDIVRLCVIKQLRLLEAGMQLHLQSRGLDAAQRQDRLQLGDRHVGHADVSYFSLVHQLLALSPGRHEFIQVKGSGIGIAGVAVAARRMIVGEGPVHEIQVDIGQLQILQALFAGSDHLSLSVHVVPHLGGNEQLLPLHDPFLQHALQGSSDPVLIHIYGSAVDQTVSRPDAAVNSLCDLFRPVFVASEGSHSDGRHCGPVIQRPAGDFVLLYDF